MFLRLRVLLFASLALVTLGPWAGAQVFKRQ